MNIAPFKAKGVRRGVVLHVEKTSVFFRNGDVATPWLREQLLRAGYEPEDDPPASITP